jgi:hypothetical protein
MEKTMATRLTIMHPDGSVTHQADADLLSIPHGDPLAYMFGFHHAVHGQEVPDTDDLAEGYLKGHEHGLQVYGGDKPMPSWYVRAGD